MVYYLVAAYSNAASADAAYQQLAADFPTNQLELISQDPAALETLQVFDPNHVAWKQSLRMLIWLIPFGFFAGFTFHDITHYTLWDIGSPFLNHCLGGLLGAISGAMGGFSFGGGLQFLFDQEKLSLRKRLLQGQSLLVARGSDLFIRQVNRALKPTAPEALQSYTAPQ